MNSSFNSAWFNLCSHSAAYCWRLLLLLLLLVRARSFSGFIKFYFICILFVCLQQTQHEFRLTTPIYLCGTNEKRIFSITNSFLSFRLFFLFISCVAHLLRIFFDLRFFRRIFCSFINFYELRSRVVVTFVCDIHHVCNVYERVYV